MRSRKLIYLLGIVGLVILNSLYISYQFMIILIVLIAVGLFCFFVQKVSVARAMLYVAFDKSNVTFGDVIKVGVMLDNRFILRTPWARANVTIRCSNGEHETRVINLNRYDNLKKVNKNKFSITPKHCGVVYLHMNDCVIRDYLHMFSTTLKYNFVRKAYVFPKLVKPESKVENDVQNDSSEDVVLNRRENDEIVELREYQEGDRINRIHWNLSSVYDEYIVKQYGEEVDTRAYICADLSVADKENFRDDLDKIYQWVYSIAAEIIDKNGTVVLMAWDESRNSIYEVEAVEQSELDICMQGLMDIRCSRDAMTRLDKYMDWEEREYQKRPMVVTAEDYESDIYEILKVTEDDLQEVLSQL
ncbi:MAG: DUF58 domain-containing protein [Lachnospira sp.]|nr:DUF58 domain-containing protein [Lachnospira sp.]